MSSEWENVWLSFKRQKKHLEVLAVSMTWLKILKKNIKLMILPKHYFNNINHLVEQ